jgi:hypothetical protein
MERGVEQVAEGEAGERMRKILAKSKVMLLPSIHVPTAGAQEQLMNEEEAASLLFRSIDRSIWYTSRLKTSTVHSYTMVVISMSKTSTKD